MGAAIDGRGLRATADMKARIDALRRQGLNIVDILWERNRLATAGEGFEYEFAEERPDEVRPAGHPGREHGR